MGSGASSENENHRGFRFVLDELRKLPADATDITNLEQAKSEIIKVRKVAREVAAPSNNALRSDGNSWRTTNKRKAIVDKTEASVRRAVESPTYRPMVVQKAPGVRDILFGVVSSSILFRSCSPAEHTAIVDAFSKCTSSAGAFIINQDETGDVFYVIQTGAVEVLVRKDGSVRQGSTLSAGDSFGELALLYDTPRAASVRAISDCVLWSINRETYRSIIVHLKSLQRKEILGFLRDVTINNRKLCSAMCESDLEKMASGMEKESFLPGDVIIREGNVGDHFYFLTDGKVAVSKTNDSGEDVRVALLERGAYFGERALLREELRQASCIADTIVTCLSLGRNDFIAMIGSLEDIFDKDNRPVRVKTEEAAAVESIIHRNANAATDTSPINNVDSDGFSRDLRLSDFAVGRTLGCGAFGRVKLCRLKGNDAHYALKCQAKSLILSINMQERVVNELEIMRQLDHPFIAKLFGALQDDRYLYFVIELLQGGELFTHLRDHGKVTENAARFYAGSVIYAYCALHAKRIAYRDLKPENLVMDAKGFIKLVDFGLAKQLGYGKTWTMCGTPDYLAPEIILNEGHDIAVDYWALGVLLYEMVFGAPPFYADDPMQVYSKVLNTAPVMPEFFSKSLANLIRRLLCVQQGKRLGNTREGLAGIIKHKWFSSFDWLNLENRRMTPPYIPTVSSNSDITNFDKFDEEELPPSCDWNPRL